MTFHAHRRRINFPADIAPVSFPNWKTTSASERDAIHAIEKAVTANSHFRLRAKEDQPEWSMFVVYQMSQNSISLLRISLTFQRSISPRIRLNWSLFSFSLIVNFYFWYCKFFMLNISWYICLLNKNQLELYKYTKLLPFIVQFARLCSFWLLVN